MRRDDAERAGVQDARNIVRRVRGHPHRRHDADVEAGQADLPGGIHRQRRMLQVDVEHVEARGLGDPGDLDGAGSRTVIEATTSPRASLSLTLFRRMSLAAAPC